MFRPVKLLITEAHLYKEKNKPDEKLCMIEIMDEDMPKLIDT